jgi:hypothetical protein
VATRIEIDDISSFVAARKECLAAIVLRRVGVNDLLDISQPHATVKDVDTPTLSADSGTSNDTDVCKRKLLSRSIVSILL